MKNNELIFARKKKGYSQEELAKLMGCEKTTVSNWENGYSTPKLIDAFRLAGFLGQDINYIFLRYRVQESQTVQSDMATVS